MRKEFVGRVNVFREFGSLTVEVKTDCGQTFMYFNEPKCFVEPTFYPQNISNSYRASFRANENGSNPRSLIIDAC